MAKGSAEHINSSEISPQIKLESLKEILPLLDGNRDLVISGSLSELISRRQHDGNITIASEDLIGISDIDIGSIIWGVNEVSQKACKISKETGFQVEISPIAQNCAYLSSGVRDLALSSVDLQIEGNEAGKGYRILYTTPEFLLLSLVDQAISEKTPAKKYLHKLTRIQNHPKFSEERFSTLALDELAVRYAMNEGTFNIWKKMVSEGSEGTNLEKELEGVSSLIDQAEFFNLAKMPADLKSLDYSKVRKISQLEKFLREMKEKE